MLPEGFKNRMRELLSEEEFEDFCSDFDGVEERHRCLRINRLKVHGKTDNNRIFESIKDKTKKCEFIRVPWEEDGYYYDANLTPGKHPYHEAGLYYIQEPSAMAPVHFLDPMPGERVLDLCAAPGGKSTQIACRMRGNGILVTNEINRDRAKILSLNIERLGITNALVLNEDPDNLVDRFEGYFDKILVDAPCSGEGMFRKNDNATSEWSAENVQLCATRQSHILEMAARMLRPGGRMVYSTCTFAPEENEENVYRFLMNNSDFHVVKVQVTDGMEYGRRELIDRSAFKENNDKAYEEAGYSVRLWPHRVSGEGHFLCVFKRDGDEDRRSPKSFVPGGRIKPASSDVTALFKEFMKETCMRESVIAGGVFFSFGDQLYLCPEDMPSINGLKVLRPGLHLGTIKKGRFEPSHALALSLDYRDVDLFINISSESQQIRQFLNGQSLRLSGEENEDLRDKKGWCLVCCDGYSIGWAKLSNGMLKNHYPKGLRINY